MRDAGRQHGQVPAGFVEPQPPPEEMARVRAVRRGILELLRLVLVGVVEIKTAAARGIVRPGEDVPGEVVRAHLAVEEAGARQEAVLEGDGAGKRRRRRREAVHEAAVVVSSQERVNAGVLNHQLPVLVGEVPDGAPVPLPVEPDLPCGARAADGVVSTLPDCVGGLAEAPLQQGAGVADRKGEEDDGEAGEE